MAKKRPGRPPKSSAQRKSESLLIRLEVEEKEGFRQAATVAGIDLSTWARERLRLAAIRDLEDAGRPIPFLSSLDLE